MRPGRARPPRPLPFRAPPPPPVTSARGAGSAPSPPAAPPGDAQQQVPESRPGPPRSPRIRSSSGNYRPETRPGPESGARTPNPPGPPGPVLPRLPRGTDRFIPASPGRGCSGRSAGPNKRAAATRGSPRPRARALPAAPESGPAEHPREDALGAAGPSAGSAARPHESPASRGCGRTNGARGAGLSLAARLPVGCRTGTRSRSEQVKSGFKYF